MTGDIRGRLEVDGPLLRRAMADVLGSVWAGAVHLLYGYVDWAVKQLFGDTAEEAQLRRQAAIYGITPVAATYATGSVTATGSNGSSILAETILRFDASTAYRVTTGQVIAGGTATVPIAAVLAGAAGNVPAGTVLTFETPVGGVNAATTVVSDITNGQDQEGKEELRDRYLLRKRRPPQGGADQDYEAWLLETPGCTRAWVYPNELGLGTVVGRFVQDGDGVSIFPDAGEVTTAQAYVDARRPIAAEFTAAAPTNLSVNFTISITPDNADTRAAVDGELADLIRRVGEPGDGIGRGTISLAKVRTAIDTSAGVTSYVLTVPAADVVPAVGQLPTMGAITWV